MRYENLARNLTVLGLTSIVISVVVAIVVVVSAITNDSAALGLLVGAGILVTGIFFGLVEISLGAIIVLLNAKSERGEANNDKKL